MTGAQTISPRNAWPVRSAAWRTAKPPHPLGWTNEPRALISGMTTGMGVPSLGIDKLNRASTSTETD